MMKKLFMFYVLIFGVLASCKAPSTPSVFDIKNLDGTTWVYSDGNKTNLVFKFEKTATFRSSAGPVYNVGYGSAKTLEEARNNAETDLAKKHRKTTFKNQLYFRSSDDGASIEVYRTFQPDSMFTAKSETWTYSGAPNQASTFRMRLE